MSFNNKSYYGINVDCNGKTIYICDACKITFPNKKCYNDSLTISNGTLTGINCSYAKLESASVTAGLQILSSMKSVTITNCIFNQIGIVIGDSSKSQYTNELLIDNCQFDYTMSAQNQIALIDTAWNGGETITISNSTFVVDTDFTLHLGTIQEGNGKVSINLSGNTWKCNRLDYYTYAAGNTLPSYNAFNADNECDKDQLQSSTTAFISSVIWYIKDNSQYISLNDDGTNSYTVEGVTKRNSSTTLITNNVDAWGVIINED